MLKTILAILETLYGHLNPDAGACDVRFASLEEAVTMLNTATTNWKENTIAECLSDWKQEALDKNLPVWKKEYADQFKENCERNASMRIARNLASKGMDEEQIASVIGLTSEEVRLAIH